MKKITTKKLSLDATTVRTLQQNLNDKQLQNVVGGQGPTTDACGSSRVAVC